MDTMKKNEMTILSAMEEIVELAKRHSIDTAFFTQAADSLAFLSKKLGLSVEEAMLLAFFFEKSSSNRIWISSIADMINVSNIRIISMITTADSLVKKGYIRCNESNREEKYYKVPFEVINSIRLNKPVVPKPICNLSVDDFFDRLGELFDEEDIPFHARFESLVQLINNNMHLPYCKVIKEYNLNAPDLMLVNVFANRLINEDDDNIGTHDWEEFFPSKSHVRRLQKTLKNGTSALIVNKILKPKGDDGVRDPDFYNLTNEAKEALFPDMDVVDQKSQQDRVLTSFETFAPKKLYYPKSIQAQIDRLADLLRPEQFKLVTERLSENGMRKGFAALFYGAPGVGKSETVNQLARMTGRDVLAVDVARIKSCWVGESEQNIRALFERYRKYVRERGPEKAPILLFNEADQLLGIRQEGAQKAVDKMENSIQNIILEEIEKLEGILIATTNLTGNLDKAFERRFIYKIEFERPDFEAKKQIWKSMIPSLQDEVADVLAKEFDLSGGQIENVARKRTVELILSGVEPSVNELREYCRTEKINSKGGDRARIGF